MKNIFQLIPTNGRKSFNGKCKVVVANNKAELLSYDTIVASIDLETRHYEQIWEGNTATTNNHIKEFKQFYSVS
jgi:hypothetical protein